MRLMRSAASGALLALAAACGNDLVGPDAVPPGAHGARRWSDATGWPGGVLPTEGVSVRIAAGDTVLLDMSPPPLGGLLIDGSLIFDQREVALAARSILVHGALHIGTERVPFRHRATITLTGPVSDENLMGMGTKLIGVMGGTLEIHGPKRLAWTRLAATARAGDQRLVLERHADWRAGDRLILASTDFEPGQAEEVLVTAVNGPIVEIAAPLRHSHYGELQTIAGVRVDERAEVGLLTRDIVIQGDSSSTSSGFGGHVMIMAGGSARVDGVTFRRMGQRGRTGRYPIHWHFAGSPDRNYANDNAVWQSLNRCMTIHNTHGITLARNVCSEHPGHGFFIEDGAETRNTLEDNLGVLSVVPPAGTALLPSDSRPATFWITNPDNVIRGNVAAGSRGFGFWYALPEHPTGASTDATIWPRRTPLGEFRDNVAHSNRRGGLHVDDGPMPDGNTQVTSFRPRQTPAADSPPVVAQFRGFRGWKHSGRAVWLRGGDTRLIGAVLSSNAIGATFASNETFLEDATVIGETANIDGTTLPATFPIRGFEFYDGRVGVRRTTFVNYRPREGRPASALGFNRANAFSLNTGNFAEDVRFIDANPVWIEPPRADRDGDKASVFLDVDGKVTGRAGQFVAGDYPLITPAGCTRRAEWNAWSCPGRFVQARMTSETGENVAPLDIVRKDGIAGSFVGVGNQPLTVTASLALGLEYTFRFPSGAPLRPRVTISRLDPADAILIALPASGTPIVVRDYNTSRPLTAAASLADVRASSGDLWWRDPATGLVWIKAMARAGNQNVTYAIR